MNPYAFWKKNLSVQQYEQVVKGMKLFNQVVKNTNFLYEDYIDFLLIDNSSLELTYEMIHSTNPIEFVLNNQNSSWDWIGVGFYTSFEFRKKFLAHKVAKIIRKK